MVGRSIRQAAVLSWIEALRLLSAGSKWSKLASASLLGLVSSYGSPRHAWGDLLQNMQGEFNVIGFNDEGGKKAQDILASCVAEESALKSRCYNITLLA